MTVKEIKRKIESISYPENRYIKDGALIICNDILNFSFLNNLKRKEVEKIRLFITNTKEPWSWNDVPNRDSYMHIVREIYKLHEILDEINLTVIDNYF